MPPDFAADGKYSASVCIVDDCGNTTTVKAGIVVSTDFYWAAGVSNTWDTTTAEWHVGGTSGPLYAWIGGGNAIFPESSANTPVTIDDTNQIIVSSVTVAQGGDYTLSGGSLAAGATPLAIDAEGKLQIATGDILPAGSTLSIGALGRFRLGRQHPNGRVPDGRRRRPDHRQHGQPGLTAYGRYGGRGLDLRGHHRRGTGLQRQRHAYPERQQ